MPELPQIELVAAEAVQQNLPLTKLENVNQIALEEGNMAKSVVQPQVDLVDLIDKPAWKTILLDLVRSEQMNPWEIDIAELAEKYLNKINQLTKVSLRIPANAILASAILLKMKAKSLKISALEEEIELAEGQQLQLMDESEIPDLKGLRKLREGRISLEELVETIDAVLEKTKKSELKKTFKALPSFTIPLSEENLSEKIEFVYSKIIERADSQGLVLFSRLIETKDPTEMVNTFIPLLFLVNNKKVNAWQDEFWGEIFVQLIQEQLQNKTVLQQN